MSRIAGYSCLYRVYAINLKVRQSIDIQLINALLAEREVDEPYGYRSLFQYLISL